MNTDTQKEGKELDIKVQLGMLGLLEGTQQGEVAELATLLNIN